MTQSDFAKFKALWASVLENYGNPVSDMATVLAFNALSQFSLAQIQEALMNHLQNSEFRPTVKDVFQFCNKETQKLQVVAGLSCINTQRFGVIWGNPVQVAA